MRDFTVKFFLKKDDFISDDFESVCIPASSSTEAISLCFDYLQDQVIQNSNLTADISNNEVIVSDYDGNYVESYVNFSVDSEIKKLRLDLGLSRAELSRRLEIPLRNLENWESSVVSPAHWVEKLLLEKLESMKLS